MRGKTEVPAQPSSHVVRDSQRRWENNTSRNALTPLIHTSVEACQAETSVASASLGGALLGNELLLLGALSSRSQSSSIPARTINWSSSSRSVWLMDWGRWSIHIRRQRVPIKENTDQTMIPM